MGTDHADPLNPDELKLKNYIVIRLYIYWATKNEVLLQINWDRASKCLPLDGLLRFK